MSTSHCPPASEREPRHLATIASRAEEVDSVAKEHLGWGDWVLVTTHNSIYTLCVLGDDTYAVSGGWFDDRGLSPSKMRINGCTWGGSAIKQDIVAARGLFMEFGNRVVTTRIRNVKVVRGLDAGPAN